MFRRLSLFCIVFLRLAICTARGASSFRPLILSDVNLAKPQSKRAMTRAVSNAAIHFASNDGALREVKTLTVNASVMTLDCIDGHACHGNIATFFDRHVRQTSFHTTKKNKIP